MHSIILPRHIGTPFIKSVLTRTSPDGKREAIVSPKLVSYLKSRLQELSAASSECAELLRRLENPHWVREVMDDLLRFKGLATFPSRVLAQPTLLADLERWKRDYDCDVPIDPNTMELLQGACAPFLLSNSSRHPALMLLRNPSRQNEDYLEHMAKTVAYSLNARFLSVSPHDLPISARPRGRSTGPPSDRDEVSPGRILQRLSSRMRRRNRPHTFRLGDNHLIHVMIAGKHRNDFEEEEPRAIGAEENSSSEEVEDQEEREDDGNGGEEPFMEESQRLRMLMSRELGDGQHGPIYSADTQLFHEMLLGCCEGLNTHAGDGCRGSVLFLRDFHLSSAAIGALVFTLLVCWRGERCARYKWVGE